MEKEGIAHLCMWTGIALTFNPSIIPLVLSSIASTMAIVNYLLTIKKNRK